MADIESNVKVNIDTSDALAQLKLLQQQISAFQQAMRKAGADNALAARQMQQNLVNSINATGKFQANIQTIQTSAERFTGALEKNKLSMGEYFRYAGGASKTFGKLFKSEFETINQVARERVKELQTQYIKLGRDANGAMKAIAVKPLALDMDNLGTKTQMAAQRQQLFNQLMKQGSTNLLNFGKNTQWAGRQLMVGFTVPLTLMGSAAAKAYMEIEKASISFKRVYGDINTTAEETEKMARSVRALADEFTKYGAAVSDTMDMAAKAAAMGKTGSDLLAQISQAAKLAVLGQVDQNQALETTISLTNAFGVSAADLSKNIDFLNAVENQTVTSIEDLTIAIPKAAPVVQQLGGDVEDLTFFLTAMKEGGINASEGANALKSGLASMINPSKKASEFLAGFNINVKGIVESNKGDVRGTVIGMAKAFDTLDPLNRARAIEQLFGKFQFSRISTLFQNVIKEGSQANTVALLANQTAEELSVLSEREMRKISDSPMFKFQKSIQDIQAKLAPVGEAFLKAVTPIVEFVSKILDGFNNLSEGSKQFITILVTAVAGIGPLLLMTFGLVANGVANIIKLFTNVKIFMNKTTKPSDVLGEQTSYMNTEQLRAAAIAASLDQAHAKLRQTFTSEAAAVNELTAAYRNAVQAQQAYAGVPGVPTGNPSATPNKYANGVSMVPGPAGAGDIVPALLSPGEAVIPARSAKKYAPVIRGMIAGNLPGFENGTTGAGMRQSVYGPLTQKQTDGLARTGSQLKEISDEVKAGPYGNVPPTDFGTQISPTTGHSFPAFSVGGIYEKPDGTRVFVKPQMDLTSALAEVRGTTIARDAHGLVAPKQEIRVMMDPTDPENQRKFIVLESALDSRIADIPNSFNKDQYFTQLVASLLRGDKDLGVGNLGGNVLADVGTAGVFGRASGKRALGSAINSMEEQAIINLLGVKGGAKRFFAEATSEMVSKLTPAEYDAAMKAEIQKVIPKLDATIAGFGPMSPEETVAYQGMQQRLRSGLGVDWAKYQVMHSAVPPKKFALGGIVPDGYHKNQLDWMSMSPEDVRTVISQNSMNRAHLTSEMRSNPVIAQYIRKIFGEGVSDDLINSSEVLGNLTADTPAWMNQKLRVSDIGLPQKLFTQSWNALQGKMFSNASVAQTADGQRIPPSGAPVVQEIEDAIGRTAANLLKPGKVKSGEPNVVYDSSLDEATKQVLLKFSQKGGMYELVANAFMNRAGLPGTIRTKYGGDEQAKVIELIKSGQADFSPSGGEIKFKGTSMSAGRWNPPPSKTKPEERARFEELRAKWIADGKDINQLPEELKIRGTSQSKGKLSSKENISYEVLGPLISKIVNPNVFNIEKMAKDAGFLYDKKAGFLKLAKGGIIPGYKDGTPAASRVTCAYCGAPATNVVAGDGYDQDIAVCNKESCDQQAYDTLSAYSMVDTYSLEDYGLERLKYVAQGKKAKQKASVFDIDDTLLDLSSFMIQHQAENENLPEDQKKKWYKEVAKDPKGIPAGLAALKAAQQRGNKILLMTARPDFYEPYTMETLQKLGIDMKGVKVIARQDKDYRKPEQMKYDKTSAYMKYYDIEEFYDDMAKTRGAVSLLGINTINPLKLADGGFIPSIAGGLGVGPISANITTKDGGFDMLKGNFKDKQEMLDILSQRIAEDFWIDSLGEGDKVSDYLVNGIPAEQYFKGLMFNNEIVKGYNKGGMVAGYANGVFSVPGPKGAGDVVPAMLSPGEAVIPAKQAAKHRPMIQQMIAGNLPGYAMGGIIPGYNQGIDNVPGGRPVPVILVEDRTQSDSGAKMEEVLVMQEDVAEVQLKGEEEKKLTDKQIRANIKKQQEDAKKEAEEQKRFRDNEKRVNAGYDQMSKAERAKFDKKLSGGGISGVVSKLTTPSKFSGRMASAGYLASGVAAAASALPADGPLGGIATAAQAALPAIGAMTGAMQMIPGPAGVAVGAIMAIGTIIMQVNAELTRLREESYKLASAMGSGNASIQKFADFAKTVSGTEAMNKKREASAGQFFNVVEGKTTFGESYMKSDSGKELVKNVTESIKTGGFDQAANLITQQLSTAVASGVMNTAQARSIAANLGKQLKSTNFSLTVSARLTNTFGPNGENLKENPLQVRLGIAKESSQLFKKFTEDAVNAKDSFGSDEKFGGALAANLTSALDVQQQMVDSLQISYEKRIAQARAAGDEAAAIDLQNRYLIEQKDLMSANAMASKDIFSQLEGLDSGVLGQARTAGLKAIEDAYKGTGQESLATIAKDRIETKMMGTDEQDTILANAVASKQIGFKQLEIAQQQFGGTSAGATQLNDMILEKGGVEVNRALGLTELMGEETKKQFLVDFGLASPEKAKEMNDAFELAQKTIGPFADDEVTKTAIVDFNVKNADQVLDAKNNIKALEGLSGKKITLAVTTGSLFDANVQNAIKKDIKRFNKYNDAGKLTYTTTLQQIMKMEGDAAMINAFKVWRASQGDPTLTFADYAVYQADRTVRDSSIDNSKGPGSESDQKKEAKAPEPSILDPYVKMLREANNWQQKLTTGWNDSFKAIMKYTSASIKQMGGFAVLMQEQGAAAEEIQAFMNGTEEEQNRIVDKKTGRLKKNAADLLKKLKEIREASEIGLKYVLMSPAEKLAKDNELYQAGLDVIAIKEKKVNEKYNARIKALDEIGKIQEKNNQKQQDSMTLADALSKGDIAAAAKAALQAKQNDQKAALEDAKTSIENARKIELEGIEVRINGVLTDRTKLEATLEGNAEKIAGYKLLEAQRVADIEQNALKSAKHMAALLKSGQALSLLKPYNPGTGGGVPTNLPDDKKANIGKIGFDKKGNAVANQFAAGAGYLGQSGMTSSWDFKNNKFVVTKRDPNKDKEGYVPDKNTPGKYILASKSGQKFDPKNGIFATRAEAQKTVKAGEIVTWVPSDGKDGGFFQTTLGNRGTKENPVIGEPSLPDSSFGKNEQKLTVKEKQWYALPKGSWVYRVNKFGGEYSIFYGLHDMNLKKDAPNLQISGSSQQATTRLDGTEEKKVKYLTTDGTWTTYPIKVPSAKFARGGLVPKGYAEGGAVYGTDTIPAMLTPGEFVIKKSAVDSIGADNLNAMNNGTSVGESVYNYSITVNANSSDASDIADSVLREIKRIDSRRIRSSAI